MTITAVDADVVIFAAARDHPLARGARRLISDSQHCVGSVLLLPELLVKPIRSRNDDEVRAIEELLAGIELLAVDDATASLATVLGARYGLRALDATHLATAVSCGADRFATNNTRDFDASTIEEIEVVHPTG